MSLEDLVSGTKSRVPVVCLTSLIPTLLCHLLSSHFPLMSYILESWDRTHLKFIVAIFFRDLNLSDPQGYVKIFSTFFVNYFQQSHLTIYFKSSFLNCHSSFLTTLHSEVLSISWKILVPGQILFFMCGQRCPDAWGSSHCQAHMLTSQQASSAVLPCLFM